MSRNITNLIYTDSIDAGMLLFLCLFGFRRMMGCTAEVYLVANTFV